VPLSREGLLGYGAKQSFLTWRPKVFMKQNPYWFTAKTRSSQTKDTFLLPLRGRQKKKINHYAIFLGSKGLQGMLLIVFRPLNEKQ